MIPNQVTLYEVLGVKQDAPSKEIKAAYRKLSKHVHPDKTNSATANLQALVNNAHETLSDEGKRIKYDRQLRDQGKENNGRSVNNFETELLRRRLQEMHQQNLQLQQREAQVHRQLKQSQQQVRQSEEMLRQRNMKLNKERMKSHQQLRQKEYELQREKERNEAEKIAPFRCGICWSIVPSSNFWASGCCRKLFCGECLIKCGNITVCQYAGCNQSIRVFQGSSTPAGWTQNDPFTKASIEDAAPICDGCKQNILKPDVEAHKRLCPALNQFCYKCNGTGKLQGPFSTFAACNACEGKGIPRGDWTRCFACLDEIQSDLSSFCQMCFGNKCFQGKWSPCFRCECKGVVKQITTSIAEDYCPTKDESRNETIILHSITAMPKYADKSFEELRLEGYTAARHPTERLVTCEVCEGKRKLKGDWIKCTVTSCNAGRVQMFNGTLIHCSICNGMGSVSVQNGSADLHNGEAKHVTFA